MKKLLFTFVTLLCFNICQAQEYSFFEKQQNRPPKLKKITWVGENNEYFKISKRTASFEDNKVRLRFDVILFEKNFFTLVKTEYYASDGKVKKRQIEQKYEIVYFSKDTLIISPIGTDSLQIGQLNDNQ